MNANLEGDKLSGKPSRQQSVKGFTLVELLVALFVFSLLSAFAYRAINTMTKTGSAIEAEMTALTNMQKAIQSIERDLRQKSVPVVASATEESLELNSDKTQLELTMLASSQVKQTQAMKHIRYSLKGNELLREVWRDNKSVLEAADDTVVLLKGVKTLEFSALDQASSATSNSWPAYFKIALEHEDLGSINRAIYFGLRKPELNFTTLTENTQKTGENNQPKTDSHGNPLGQLFNGSHVRK